jgi:hypothetical protein
MAVASLRLVFGEPLSRARPILTEFDLAADRVASSVDVIRRRLSAQ